MRFMGNLVVYTVRKVTAKGLFKGDIINTDKLEDYFLDGDKEKLELINFTLSSNLTKPRLFYPACGADIIYLLFFVQKVFDVEEINLILNDIESNLGIIKTILDDIGVSFSESNISISFYWDKMLVNLTFVVGDVFSLDLPEFDIYFERAFRIMKSDKKDYEKKIFDKLSVGGFLISDSGFNHFDLDKVDACSSISSYEEMIVGEKKGLSRELSYHLLKK
jgi:hypothetical protein